MPYGSRYLVYGEIARGGMATVRLGKLVALRGFSRSVAIKQLHPTYARDARIVARLVDEARIASRVRHPNVVPVLDVVAERGELLLVMEYIHGEALSAILRACGQAGELVPPAIAVNIVAAVLHGLHAAHEATDETGRPLEIVHRDVSPQNILVGVDGIARVTDFGIATALNRSEWTRDGELRGKLAYMAPEQIQGTSTRRTDVYAASVVLWEALTRRRLYSAPEAGALVAQILAGDASRPSDLVDGISPELDAIVMRGLSREPDARFATALEMAEALERVAPLLPARTIGAWVERLASASLAARAEAVSAIDSGTSVPVSVTNGHDGPGTTASVDLSSSGVLPAHDRQRVAARDEAPVGVRRALASIAGVACGVALTVFAASRVFHGLDAAARVEHPGAAAPASAPAPVEEAVVPEPRPAEANTDAEPDAGSKSAAAPPPRAAEARPHKVAAPRRAPRPKDSSDCSPPYREILVEGHLRRIPKDACL